MFSSQFKFYGNFSLFSVKFNDMIATKFCTCHDSYAVMACAKLCCNLLKINWVTANWILLNVTRDSVSWLSFQLKFVSEIAHWLASEVRHHHPGVFAPPVQASTSCSRYQRRQQGETDIRCRDLRLRQATTAKINSFNSKCRFIHW